MVSQEVRDIEREIDLFIENLPIWTTKRDVLLTRLMEVWRDGLEVVALALSHALTFNIEGGLEKSIAQEYQLVTGVYQAVKWAMMYASEDGPEELDARVLTELVLKTASRYQILVDALKMGAHDRVEFTIDHASKTLTIFEGGDLTGYDEELLRRGHLTTPFHAQSPLVEDSDKLTTDWSAGQGREYWRWLNNIAEKAETETIMARAGPIAPVHEVMKRPVVMELPIPPATLEKVQRDLTLTVAKVRSPLNWKIDTWHDCPLIQIGDGVFGVSLGLRTIQAMRDDYLLRAAVLNDPTQYEKASAARGSDDRRVQEGLREGRLGIHAALSPLQSRARDRWIRSTRFRDSDCPAEVDAKAAIALGGLQAKYGRDRRYPAHGRDGRANWPIG
jgi:hypothetical protein